jgi:hypothetical protein
MNGQTELSAPEPTAAAKIAGPITVHPINPRYFTDGSGKAIYLTGSHWGFELQDDAWDVVHTFDFDAYLDFLVNYNHNLVRMWVVEHTRSDVGPPEATAHPMPYARSNVPGANDGGNKFDLDRWDEEFFSRLRQRVVAAAERGIYVSVMLFQGFSIMGHQRRLGTQRQFGHPFHANNNVNGVDGDLNGEGHLYAIHRRADPDITARQEAYVRKVIDTVNDLDNVLYEIANEDGHGSVMWQYHMIEHIRSYEATKPKQHPVGMTFRAPGGTDAELFCSPADWISPRGLGKLPSGESASLVDPAVSDGSKVIILDTDHGSAGTDDPKYPWRSFLRGNNTWVIEPDVIADLSSGSKYDGIRRAMGDTRAYADKMDLAAMTPSTGAVHCSTGYVLHNPGAEYLVYQPRNGDFCLDLAAGTFDYEWFDPTTSSVVKTGSATVGVGIAWFSPPFSGPAVLYLKSKDIK